MDDVTGNTDSPKEVSVVVEFVCKCTEFTSDRYSETNHKNKLDWYLVVIKNVGAL